MGDCVIQMRRVGNPATCHGVKDIFRLVKEKNVIGRNSLVVDVYINSSVHPKLISREHAIITLVTENGGVVELDVTDKSINGTFVNDAKIQGTVPLAVGDTVTFGHLQGIKVRPWQIAKQPNSEFRFQIEKVTVDVPNKDVSHKSPGRRPLANFNHSHSQTPTPTGKKSESTTPQERIINRNDNGSHNQRKEGTMSPVLGNSPTLHWNAVLGENSPAGRDSPVLGTDFSNISTSSTVPGSSLTRGSQISGRDGPVFSSPLLCSGSPMVSSSSKVLVIEDGSIIGRSSPMSGRNSPVLGKEIPVSDGKSPCLSTSAPLVGRCSPVLGGKSPILNNTINTVAGSSRNFPGPEKGDNLNNEKSEQSKKRNSVRETVEDIESRNAKNNQSCNVTLPNGFMKVSPRICSSLPTSSILPKQLILGVPACRVQSLPSRNPTPPKREFNFPSLEARKSPVLAKDVFEFKDGGESTAESDEDIFALTSKVKYSVQRLTQEAEDDSFSANFDEPSAPPQGSGTSKNINIFKCDDKLHNTRRKSTPLAVGVRSALAKSTSKNGSLNSRKRKSDGVLPSAKRSNSEPDVCAAAKCLKPTGKMIPWVQCDDCDGWYHTRCSGCKFEEVRKSTAAFHCGCV